MIHMFSAECMYARAFEPNVLYTTIVFESYLVSVASYPRSLKHHRNICSLTVYDGEEQRNAFCWYTIVTLTPTYSCSGAEDTSRLTWHASVPSTLSATVRRRHQLLHFHFHATIGLRSPQSILASTIMALLVDCGSQQPRMICELASSVGDLHRLSQAKPCT